MRRAAGVMVQWTRAGLDNYAQVNIAVPQGRRPAYMVSINTDQGQGGSKVVRIRHIWDPGVPCAPDGAGRRSSTADGLRRAARSPRVAELREAMWSGARWPAPPSFRWHRSRPHDTTNLSRNPFMSPNLRQMLRPNCYCASYEVRTDAAC